MKKIYKKVKEILDNVVIKIRKNTMSGTKKEGGKEVIMEFALGAIAIVLAVVFRDQLQNVIETVGSSFSSKISALFNRL